MTRSGPGQTCLHGRPPPALPSRRRRPRPTRNSESPKGTIQLRLHGTPLSRTGAPTPPLEKSCADRARNSVARMAAQIRTGHWRSAVFLHRIRRRANDLCWLCNNRRRVTRSHVLLHCNGDLLAAARTLAWEGRRPANVRVLLADPRWEARLLRFLESPGVGRVVDEVDVEDGRCG